MARENTFKTKALAFITANPGLKRKDYVEAFVGFGMKQSAASLYHYLHVTKAGKVAPVAPVAEVETAPELEVAPELDTLEAKEEEVVAAAPRKRDAKGRFVKAA